MSITPNDSEKSKIDPLDSSAERAANGAKERRYATEVGVYFMAVTLMLAGFLSLWSKAMRDGSYWWIATIAAFVFGVFTGERLKKRVETLIRLSRELRSGKKKA